MGALLSVLQVTSNNMQSSVCAPVTPQRIKRGIMLISGRNSERGETATVMTPRKQHDDEPNDEVDVEAQLIMLSRALSVDRRLVDSELLAFVTNKQVQKQLCQPVRTLGSVSPWQKVYMMCFNITVLRIEVLHELFRYRDETNGFILEGIRTEFDQTALEVPAKSWRAIRPWSITANLWKPHEDGSGRTTFIHVSRAEAGMTLASWMLDTAAYYVARGFASDVNKAAFEASLPGSPWMERMQADKDGFYRELQKIEKMRSPVPWDSRFLNRRWRLLPELQSATPPSLRKHAA
eukprot:s3337_g5.t1